MISCDDLLVKFLDYIENWKKRKSPKKCVIYAMKILTDLLNNCENEHELVEFQVFSLKIKLESL